MLSMFCLSRRALGGSGFLALHLVTSRGQNWVVPGTKENWYMRFRIDSAVLTTVMVKQAYPSEHTLTV